MRIPKPSFFAFLALAFTINPAFAQTWVQNMVGTGADPQGNIITASDNNWLVLGSLSGSTYVFSSANWGQTWTQGPVVAPADAALEAASADGTFLVAVDSGTVYTSADSGNTWTVSMNTGACCTYISSSADGTKLVAAGVGTVIAPSGSGIAYSTDAGETWTQGLTPNPGSYYAVASSASGANVVVVGESDNVSIIYTSSDYGANWTQTLTDLGGYYHLIASSTDGSKVTVAGSGVFTSTDYGATWTKQTGPPSTNTWNCLASSADGNRLALGGEFYHQHVYSSFDGGITWVTNNSPSLGWTALALSADGVKLAAIPLTSPSPVYTVRLADIDVSISATPQHVDLQDMIQVTLTVTNESTNTVTGVQVSGSVGVTGTGAVQFSGFGGPALIPTLGPTNSATLIYNYMPSNFGFVTFSATVTGQEAGNTIKSLPAFSGKVAIFPTCDLTIKTSAPTDTNFLGVGEYQQTASGDQSLSQSVDTDGAAGYVVRVQNNSSYAHSFVLTGTTNDFPSWNIQAVDGSGILGDLTSSDGWSTPTLAPGESFDIQVSLSPLAAAGLADNPSLLIQAFPDDVSDYVLDAVLMHARLVPVPVQIALLAMDADGYTSESIEAGLDDINAPLVPVTDPNVLAGEQIIHNGLVADDVTPLVLQITADPVALLQFPQGLAFTVQAVTVGPGNLNHAALSQRFAVLQDGQWQPLTSDTQLTLTSTENVGYVQLLPIASDDLNFAAQTTELDVDFSIVDKATAVQCGDQTFAVRKPPIALIHGYNTAGQWGDGFKSILGLSRPWTADAPNNFVVTITYGQDLQTDGLAGAQSYVGAPVYENTVASLDNCAQMALKAFQVGMRPLQYEWAFTRYDVVAHSQGGLLTRMLCNLNQNTTIATPFRNADNFYRGRFHRVVTIGSPHNGTRLLRYLLDLNEVGEIAGYANIPALVAAIGVQSSTAQAKFDPWGPQIAELNNPSPSSPWLPDPGASFHLVRPTIDNGASPTTGDATAAYSVLGLATTAGGAAVLPDGSDGVVDFDAMGANVPPAAVGANVYTVPGASSISHSQPIGIFGAESCETESLEIANHVIDALDQVSTVPPGDIVFGSFSVPPLLGNDVKTAIDSYASSVVIKIGSNPSAPMSKQDLQNTYTYQVQLQTNETLTGNVVWYAQVYGPNGISTDGVELSTNGPNDDQVTVTVDSGLIGDVVLSGGYVSGTNTVVLIPPTLVVSLPASGPAMTGFQILPGNIALSVGSVITPQLIASYSDGSTSFRWVTTNALSVTSSQPQVVSVANPSNWQLSSVGTSTVTVQWNGFQAQDQVTVFDPNSTNPPALSLVNSGPTQVMASWVGFTTSWQLQSSPDLSSTNWTPVSDIPPPVGGQTFVPLSATNTQQFYRLEWQP